MRTSGGTFAADERPSGAARELASVVHEEAAGAGELIGLARQHPDGEHLTGQVGPGQLERLGEIRLVLVDRAGLRLGPPCLELLRTESTNRLIKEETPPAYG